MAFTVNDARDLVRLLAEHPEWRAELRPLILGDEFLAIPARIAAIDERIARIGERIADMDARFTARFDAMDVRMNRIEGRLGNLDGERLEERYRGHVQDWFSLFLQSPALIGVSGLKDVLARRDNGSLNTDDYGRLIDTNIFVRGREVSGEDVILAAEIATRIHPDDVARADASAKILRESGYNARGLVAGHEIDDATRLMADALGVLVDLRRRSG